MTEFFSVSSLATTASATSTAFCPGFLVMVIVTAGYSPPGAFAGGVPGNLMAYTLVSPPAPSWTSYIPAVAAGVLAAVVIVLLIENRSLRKAARRL